MTWIKGIKCTACNKAIPRSYRASICNSVQRPCPFCGEIGTAVDVALAEVSATVWYKPSTWGTVNYIIKDSAE